MADMCEETYVRHTDTSIQYIPCTYVRGHKGEDHSWRTLRLQDEADREAARRGDDNAVPLDGLPSDVAALVHNISSGHADPYLEIILSVTHGRKKALRGVRGFPDLTRGHN